MKHPGLTWLMDHVAPPMCALVVLQEGGFPELTPHIDALKRKAL